MYNIVKMPEKFEVDRFIIQDFNIIFYNDIKKEQMFLTHKLNDDFIHRFTKSKEDGKPLSEYRFEIYFSVGLNEKKQAFVVIDGINILEKKKVKSYDY
jgi:hypothetical protein